MDNDDDMIKLTPKNADPQSKEASEKVVRDKSQCPLLDNPMDKVASDRFGGDSELPKV